MKTDEAIAWLEQPTHKYLLKEAITAFAFFACKSGTLGYGEVCELPSGASVEVCGPGFSERTLKARCQDAYYHVFCRDLCLAAKALQEVDCEDLGRLGFRATQRNAA